MKQLLSVSIATTGLALAALGCGALFAKGPHVPSAYQGTTQITVANAWERPLCVFTIFAEGGTPADNWLGDQGKRKNIAPGATRTFNIKPGVYHVVGGYCNGEQAVAAVGTYGAATTAIEGPSLIALGPTSVAPVEGAKTLAFTKLYPTGGAGGGDSGGGEEPAAEEPGGMGEASSPSESSSSSSSSGEAAAPSGPKCLAHGAVCNDAEHCCSGMSCASRTKFSDGSLGNGYCQ